MTTGTTEQITHEKLVTAAACGKIIKSSLLANPMTLRYDRQQFILIWKTSLGLNAIIVEEGFLLHKLNSKEWIIEQG